jgi:hypothetical protein
MAKEDTFIVKKRYRKSELYKFIDDLKAFLAVLITKFSYYRLKQAMCDYKSSTK